MTRARRSRNALLHGSAFSCNNQFDKVTLARFLSPKTVQRADEFIGCRIELYPGLDRPGAALAGSPTSSPQRYEDVPPSNVFFSAGGAFILEFSRPNQLVAQVHDRMPVILPPGAEDDWLDPDVTVEHALSLLEPYPSEEMRSVPVSPLVNSVKNDGPELLTPA